MQDLLSLLSIAKKLDIPESTLRYYTRKFDEYLPTLGKGRQKRYRPEAVEILRTIADMFKNNRSVNDIANHLRQRFPINIEGIEDYYSPSLTNYSPSELPAIFTDFMKAHIEMVNQSLAKDKALLEQQETIKQKDNEIHEVRKTLAKANNELTKVIEYKQDAEQKAKALRDHQAEIQAREKELEDMRAKLERLKTPWFIRWFKKK